MILFHTVVPLFLLVFLVTSTNANDCKYPICKPNCTGSLCSGQTFICPVNTSCYFHCLDFESCLQSTFECAEGSYCEILCKGDRSCYELDIMLAPTAKINQTCAKPRSCRANQQNDIDCLIPMDWISGGTKCSINCIEECAIVDQAAWDACMVETPNGNRTCSLVGDCLRIRGADQKNDTWVCACTSFFMGDHCEDFIWDEFPIQRLVLLIVFALMACLNILFICWVIVATITEISKKSCGQIRKRHWVTKFLICLVASTQVFKLVHILSVLSNGKSGFIDDSNTGYFSDTYHLKTGQIIIQIVDLLTFVSHDLLLCLPAIQIILWLELVTQIKLLQKNAPKFLSVLKWLVFGTTGVFLVTIFVVKVLVSLPRHLTFGPRKVVLFEAIAQGVLLCYTALWSLVTCWLVYYVWTSLSEATVYYPFLRSKLSKLSSRFKWFIFFSVCYLTNYVVLVFDFRVEINASFLHPYKAYPSTMMHALWVLDYVILFARGIAGLMTTHTYLPTVFSSEEEISGLNWKENWILFCVNIALSLSCFIGAGSYLAYNDRYASSVDEQFIQPIFIFAIFAISFVNGFFNLVLKKFELLSTLAASIWNGIILVFSISGSIVLLFSTQKLDCTPFNVVKENDLSCRVSISWISATLFSLLICLIQTFFLFSSVYTYASSWYSKSEHSYEMDTDWEDLKDAVDFGEEEETGTSDLGSESDYDSASQTPELDSLPSSPRQPKSHRNPTSPRSTPQSPTLKRTQSAQTPPTTPLEPVQPPPTSSSQPTPSVGRNYLLKTGHHKRVFPPVLVDLSETTEDVEEPTPQTEVQTVTQPPTQTNPEQSNIHIPELQIPKGTHSSRRTAERERSPQAPTKNSPRRVVDPSPRSKSRKVLSLSGNNRRTSWNTEEAKRRSTKSAEFSTDDIRRSRSRRISEDNAGDTDEETTPRRRLLQSGKTTTPRKSFWEELDETVEIPSKASTDSFSLLKDQGFGP